MKSEKAKGIFDNDPGSTFASTMKKTITRKWSLKYENGKPSNKH